MPNRNKESQFDRNDTEIIKVTRTQYEGEEDEDTDRVDVRTRFRGKDGEYYPTKKGINIALWQLPELKKALKDVS